MTREDAEALLVHVRAECGHRVEVRPDGEFFVVELERRTGAGAGTYTHYDELDCTWLRSKGIPP